MLGFAENALKGSARWVFLPPSLVLAVRGIGTMFTGRYGGIIAAWFIGDRAHDPAGARVLGLGMFLLALVPWSVLLLDRSWIFTGLIALCVIVFVFAASM